MFGSQSAMVGRSGDPSMISLSVGEMRRLVDIETSAQLALEAMRTIASPDKDLSDAAYALANALAIALAIALAMITRREGAPARLPSATHGAIKLLSV